MLFVGRLHEFHVNNEVVDSVFIRMINLSITLRSFVETFLFDIQYHHYEINRIQTYRFYAFTNEPHPSFQSSRMLSQL